MAHTEVTMELILVVTEVIARSVFQTRSHSIPNLRLMEVVVVVSHMSSCADRRNDVLKSLARGVKSEELCTLRLIKTKLINYSLMPAEVAQ